MMWSFDPKHNALLETLGMNGQELSASTLDFVYPVSTSLSGNKSDRYIERSYTHEVRNEANCSIRVLHTLQSNHIFTQKKREELTNFMQQYDVYSPEALIIQGAGTNRQFMRVFIPKNVDVTPQD